MAQYDGSIRINTNISTKDAKAQLGTLQYLIVKTADEIASLRSKMDAMKDVKFPTKEFSVLEAELKRAVSEYDKLRSKMEEPGKPTEKYKALQKELQKAQAEVEKLVRLQDEAEEMGLPIQPKSIEILANASDKVDEIKARMQSLEKEGKAFVPKVDAKDLDNAKQKIDELKQKMADLKASGKDTVLGVNTDEYANLSTQLKNEQNALAKYTAQYMAAGVSTVISKAKSAYQKLANVAKSTFSKITQYFNKSSKSASAISMSIKNILKYGLGIRSLYALVNKLRTAIKEGFSNMANEVEGFKIKVDSLKASALALKNSFAAAFRPLVEIALPYIQMVVDAMANLLDMVGQFMAAVTGQKAYTKAIKQTTAAINEENKAQNKQLSGLDKLNNLSSGNGGGTGGASEQMFEKVPIGSYFTDIAQKVRDIFSQLFVPLKEAWNREGCSVINSLKSALKEIGSLIGSIGSDFLEVWRQEKTVGIFEDILHIVGAISFAVGNLARNFRLAWEENKTGKRILEGIRDIIAVIIENIRHVADVTAEWAKNIDFSPFLTRLQGWMESLTPVFDTLSGIVMDFYEHVLLPLGKWALEKGLPELLQVLTDFNSKIDWESIRKRLAEFWGHLEPFAEAIGEGLIIFIGELSDVLAGFINSPAFEKFLDTIENWMDRVSAEDVASGLKMICKSILGYKALSSAFSVISFGAGVLSRLSSVLKFFGVGGGAAKAASAIGETGEAVTGLGESAGALSGIFGNVVNSIGYLGVGIQSLQQISKNASMDEIFDAMTKAADLLKQELNNGAISMEEYESQMKKLGDAANLAGLKNDSESIASFNAVLNEINSNIVMTSGNLDEFGEKAIEVGDNISTGLTSGFDSVDVETPIKGIFNRIIANIKKLFGIHSPSTVMAEMGVYIIQGLLNGIKSLVGNVEELWNSMKQFAVDTWNSVNDWLSQTWSSIKETASQKWAAIKQNVSEKWSQMKTDAKSKFTEIGSNIANAWLKAKENTSSAWNNMKTIVATASANIFSNIKSKFSSIQGSISSFSSTAQNIWSNIWSAMKDKAGSMLESIKNVIGSAFDWIADKVSAILNKIGSISSKASSVTGSVSSAFSAQSAAIPAVASLSNLEIPRLATGAVIPANREFLAVLGDQKHGTNIEAPLDTIKQANEEAILNVFSKLGISAGNNRSSGNETFVFQVDGKTFFEIMRKEAEQYFNCTGNPAFPI